MSWVLILISLSVPYCGRAGCHPLDTSIKRLLEFNNYDDCKAARTAVDAVKQKEHVTMCVPRENFPPEVPR